MLRMSALAAVTLALALTGATGAGATTTDETTKPRPGEAEMGWSMKDERSAAERSSDSDAAASGVPGIDVSSHQGNVDWSAQRANGKRFAYVKATESTGYTNPYFAQQYNGSYKAGMIRGAYHFANPSTSGGAAQADHFLENGGGWSADGKTLPGALDMEWNPYSDATCYGKTPSQMRSWISAFIERYEARTGRYPVIYTATSWWDQCVGSAPDITEKSPLWLARYASTPGSLPSGWGWHTFWQYTDSPIDQNVFNGSYERLQVFASR